MSTQTQLDDAVPTGEKLIHVGDHVTDREDRDRKMVVTGVPPEIEASEYKFDGDTTVAEVNPEYPSDDQVIEVKFIDKDKAYLPSKHYAYPAGRLEVLNSLHDES